MRKPVSTSTQVAADEKARNRPVNPNKVSFPEMSLRDKKAFPLSKDYQIGDKVVRGTEKIKMRALPEHPEKNPHGYVQIMRFKTVNASTGKEELILSDAFLNEDCPCLQLIREVDSAYKEDEGFRDWFSNINLSLLDEKDASENYPQEYEDAVFKRDFLELFTKPWNSYYIPVAVYADFDEKRAPGAKYAEYVNYRSSKEICYRTLVLEDWMMTKQLLTGFAVEEDLLLYASGDEELIAEAPIRLNSGTHGIAFYVWKQESADGKTSYNFEIQPGVARGPLPKAIREAIYEVELKDKDGNSYDNYPNLVKWKLMDRVKSEDERMKVILSSTLAGPLIRQGIISTPDEGSPF